MSQKPATMLTPTAKTFRYLTPILVWITCVLIGTGASAQKGRADSLLKVLANSTEDTTKVRLMWSAASAMNRYKPDSALQLAQQALYLAQRIEDEEGESRSLGIMANTFTKIGNYPRSLELNLQKLKLEEKRNKPRNLASVLMNIGIIYALQEDYREALKYYSRADSIIVKNDVKDFKFNISLNIGDTYNRLNISDSAFLFFSKSLQIAKEEGNSEHLGMAMTGLGHSYFKLDSYLQSQQHYKSSIPYLQEVNNEEVLSEAALGLANVYRKLNRPDSSAYYAKLSLQSARQGGFSGAELSAAQFLSDYFQEEHRYDSAFSYISYLRRLNDSINSRSRIREAQVITINEQFRQNELVEEQRRLAKKRNQQLQLLLIAIFIPGIFLLTLLLSRVQVHPKVVRLLGVLSLLFLFEYLTLFFHPFVANLTHHNPVFEILIFVAMAAILIPLHHKLEHWLVHKLGHYHRHNTSQVKKPATEPAVTATKNPAP